MTPLQQLRVWFRRASAGARATSIAAAVIVVALVGWLVTPVHHGSGSTNLQSSGGGVAGGASGAVAAGSGGGSPGGSAGGSVVGSTGGAGTSSGGGAASASVPSSGGGGGASLAGGAAGPVQSVTGGGPGAASQCPAGGDQGVTATQVSVAVTIINIAGAAGNGALGVPSPAEQQNDWQYVADSINASGGAGCRKVALSFYTVNPVDANNAQQQCLAIAAAHPFIVLDSGALTDVGASDCLPAQKIPLVSSYLTADQLTKYYPYYLDSGGLQTDFYPIGYLGGKQKGYFSAANGFRKLGLVYQSCRPAVVAAGRAALRRAGIPDSQTVAYDLGCPQGRQDSPADFQQAVLSFKSAGVTHVTELDDNDFASFTKIAGQQNFKPHYVVAEDAAANPQSGPLAPDPNNFDGAIDIVGGRYGEQTTPGYKPDAGTARCNAIFAKHGQPPVYQQGAGYGGVTCNYLWFITALFNHVSQMQRTALAGGMHAIGSADQSFPFGPINYAAVPAGAPHGQESWRVDQFSKSCACWQVIDPAFHAPLS